MKNLRAYIIYGFVAMIAVGVSFVVPPGSSRTKANFEEVSHESAATFTVTTNANTGAGSLRQAITDANNSPGADTINFNIPGGGFQTIAIATRLVAGIGEPVTIDGTTQPGYAGTPLVIIDGVGASASHECLTLQGNSTVKGLAFIRCRQSAIQLNTAGNNIVTGNFIGVNPSNEADTTSGNLASGIWINRTPNNRIGGSTVAERNIIGRNREGINIFEVEATNNVVIGNYIGLLFNGTDAARNTFTGVLITNAPTNRVGGSAVGERNVISGHTTTLEAGVKIDGANASGNSVIGNFIGTDATGTLDRGNAEGVRITDAPNNTVGGSTGTTPGGACTGACNLISANRVQGVSIANVLTTAATGNVVEGNFFNLNASGTALLAASTTNQSVNISGSGGNRIGGSTAASRNVIVNGGANGNNISIFGTSATTSNNIVIGNFIGTDTTGTVALGNAQTGVNISSNAAVANNRIGGTTVGERNVISGGNRTGILIGTSNQTQVSGNYIGTDVTGTLDLGNTEDGIRIQGGTNSSIGVATGTSLGGACTGGCNLISGNDRDGVRIVNVASTGNRVDYNYIGLKAAGSAALRNGVTAINLFGTQNNIIGRPLLPPFQRTESCELAIPETERCIQDDKTGSWFRFEDKTGAYTFQDCETGETRSSFGEIILNTTDVRLIGTSGGTITFNNPPTPNPGDARLQYYADGGIQINKYLNDSNVNNSTCMCPPPGEGRQTAVGDMKLGTDATNPANGIIVNYNSIGTDAKGLNILANVTEKGIDIPAGSNNQLLNNYVSTNTTVPNLTVSSGTDNAFPINTYFHDCDPGPNSFFIDLNGNLIRDPNDAGDGDGGANRTQNFPSVGVRALPQGGFSIIGSLSSTPNKRFLIVIYIIGYDSRCGRDSASPTEIAFEVTTGPSGDVTFENPINGQSALRFLNTRRITATATVINSVPLTLSDGTTSFVDVLGDTSEMSFEAAIPRRLFDFDNDGRTDISVYRPGAAASALSFWYILNSNNNTVRIIQFGVGEDKLVSADYQSDGQTDFAVWRPSNSTLYYSRINGSPSTNFVGIPWGISSDISVTGDFDGDGVNDAAVFRSSEGRWYSRSSIDGRLIVQNFGLATDKLVPADYNGDGRTDVAVYRDGVWYISECFTCPVRYGNFGLSTDVPIPADYDGDGRADLAVWRPSEGIWYLLQSTAGFAAYRWGVSTDKPQNGDFDGDNKNDIAIWRPSTGEWWIRRSSDGSIFGVQWGQNGDRPVSTFPNVQ